MDGPGSRTRDPVPKEMTGYPVGAEDRRRCASILRLLFDAQTVQNLSLNDPSLSWAVGCPSGMSIVPSTEVMVVGGGGGGGGGCGGVAVLGARRARRGSVDMTVLQHVLKNDGLIAQRSSSSTTAYKMMLVGTELRYLECQVSTSY